MASINSTSGRKVHTHEGGKAQSVSPTEELRRAVMCCMLWEKTFYESSESIGDRISNLVKRVPAEKVCKIAIEAREQMHIRHAPLWLLVECCRKTSRPNSLIAKTLERIITRPDDMTEFLALYWKGKRQPLCRGAKEGLRKAFIKFDAYQLQKYNRDNAIKLRDIMFLTHPKPKDKEQELAWKQLANGCLPTPDTWEVALSEKGADKKEVWTRLLAEKRLGDLAFLRNLRNIYAAGVDKQLILDNMHRKFRKILPFHFIAAAKAAPDLEPHLESAMLASLEEHPKLEKTTLILVDVSGSMEWDNISQRSELTRLDAACGLAMYLREVAEDAAICTFSNQLVNVPPRRGFALADAISGSQIHGGTQLTQAIRNLVKVTVNKSIYRLIVITDEQSQDGFIECPYTKGYMINIAPYEHGVGYGNGFVHINGWSQNVVSYIMEHEKNN